MLLERPLCDILQEDVEVLTIVVRPQVRDDVLVLQTVQQLYLLLKCTYFPLLSALIVANFLNENLLDGDLTTMLLIYALVHIAERAMTDHFTSLPFLDR